VGGPPCHASKNLKGDVYNKVAVLASRPLIYSTLPYQENTPFLTNTYQQQFDDNVNNYLNNR
jgi:hypothetical protein